MLTSPDDPFARWMAALEARHLAQLTFSEVSRALRALSSTYVERRQKLAAGAALSGAGKRAAFALNELGDAERDALMARLVERARQGDRILIVEPLAGFVARWWNRWRDTFEAAGGRADEWRLRTELPAIVAKLDRAAGLNHR